MALASDLLPPLDVLSVLSAGYLSVWIYGAWFAPTGLAFDAWSTYEWTALAATAMLGAVCLYDEHFGTRASRGQRAALVRRYGAGFLIFAGATLAVAFASHALDSLPSAWVMVWFGTTLLMTALARLLLAGAIRSLERDGVLTEVIAVVGVGPLADRLIRHLRQTRGNRIEILGVFDDATTDTDPGMPRAAGTVADLLALGTTRSIDWIVLTLPCTVEAPLYSLVHRLKALAAPIGLCPQNFGLTPSIRMVDYLGEGFPVTLLAARSSRRWTTVVKELTSPLRYRVLAPRQPPGDPAFHAAGHTQVSGRIGAAPENHDRSERGILASRSGRRWDDHVVTPHADVAYGETRHTVAASILAGAGQS